MHTGRSFSTPLPPLETLVVHHVDIVTLGRLLLLASALFSSSEKWVYYPLLHIAVRIKYKYMVHGMWLVLQACSRASPCKLAIISIKVHHRQARTRSRTEAAQHK